MNSADANVHLLFTSHITSAYVLIYLFLLEQYPKDLAVRGTPEKIIFENGTTLE